jgi:hypothetical protein
MVRVGSVANGGPINLSKPGQTFLTCYFFKKNVEIHATQVGVLLQAWEASGARGMLNPSTPVALKCEFCTINVESSNGIFLFVMQVSLHIYVSFFLYINFTNSYSDLMQEGRVSDTFSCDFRQNPDSWSLWRLSLASSPSKVVIPCDLLFF